MSEKNGVSEIDVALCMENYHKMPWELLEAWAGQHVAVSGDGTLIVTGGPTIEAVVANLVALQIPTNEVCLSYIPGPAEDSWL